MLTDEQMIDQIRSELREELSELQPAGRPPGQLREEARMSQGRRSRTLIKRLPATSATVLAFTVVAAVAVLLLGTVGVRRSPGSSTGGSAGGRGEIVAGDGQVLARSVKVGNVRLYPAELPHSAEARLAEQNRLHRLLQRYHINLFTPMTLVAAHLYPRAITVSGHTLAFASYVAAHPRRLPGFRVTYATIRRYPYPEPAAPFVGVVGPPGPSEVGQPHYQGVSRGAIVGQSGIEYTYDAYLRHGNTLKLSLDPALQRAGGEALQHAIDANPPANGGAFVAMNPETGAMYGLGSLPTYNPNILNKPVPNKVYEQLNNPASNYPLLDRASQFAGPVGSTLDPITALAATVASFPPETSGVTSDVKVEQLPLSLPRTVAASGESLPTVPQRSLRVSVVALCHRGRQLSFPTRSSSRRNLALSVAASPGLPSYESSSTVSQPSYSTSARASTMSWKFSTPVPSGVNVCWAGAQSFKWT